MTRIEKLEAALITARRDEAEARACGYVMTEGGAVLYVEAQAIRAGIEARLDELILEELFGDELEIAPGEIIPLSGLIDLEDRF